VAFQLDLFSSSPPSPDDGRGGAAGASGARATAVVPFTGGVVVSHGPRAAEELLLERLEALAAEARRDPSRLALPVRVVVPSRSLRRHVAAQLVRPRLAQPAQAGQPAQIGGSAQLGQPASNRAPRRAMAGVIVQTLFGLACEILERAGVAAPRGNLLFETLVERAARGEDGLRRGLGDLEDGFLAAAPAVADLLDAGLEPEHAEAVDEALASDGPRAAGHAAVERARALVRVAVRTEVRLRELGLGRRSSALRQAAEALRPPGPEQLLPARAVLLHGFVAASGVAADLLAALLRQHGATLLLDRPPVPGAEQGSETAATARLGERAAAAAALAPGGPRGWEVPAAQEVPKAQGDPEAVAARETPGIAEASMEPPAASPAPRPGPPAVVAPGLEAFTAAGAEAEAREVARRLRRLLDGGVLPEGLTVVARDLAPYRFALRRHLRRLGVPFSGVGERGGLLPAGRRAWAALDLLRWGAETPADRWLDACEWLQAELRVDLRLALRALGAARLRDVAALRERPFDAGVALPVRQGLTLVTESRRAPAGETPPGEASPRAPAGETPRAEAGSGAAAATGGVRDLELGPGSPELEPAAEPPPDDDGEGRAVARSRRISGYRLRQGVLAAARVHDRLLAWPQQATAAVQMEWLRGLLAELGLDRDPAQPLAAALAELRREVPGALALGREELRQLLARALGEGGRCPLGGEGGGVQVLSVSEARGRTFDHLFLLGLNRDVFPRPLREDPLLVDDVRQVLQRMLPDLPLAREGFDDERHAFAQLLSAAPAVTLSWRTADDDGKPLSASPFVERLLQPAASAVPWPAPALYPSQLPPCAGDANGDGAAQPSWAGDARPADEHAVLAALHGSRLALGLVLPLAVSRVREELGRPLLDLDPAAVAAARLRILEELHPDPRTAAGQEAAARLGPFFGFVGAAPSRGGHQLYVTHLEALAGCPWQFFLGRLLRIERPADPLGSLPGADPLRLGNLVHRALDRIVKRALAAAAAGPEPPQGTAGGAAQEAAGAVSRQAVGESPRRGTAAAPRQGVGMTRRAADPPPRLESALPVAVPWPDPAVLEQLLMEVAAEVLAEEGLVLPGLARALARHALPFVEVAGEVDWPTSGAAVPVYASEMDGELLVELPEGAKGARRLRFRADRVDLVDGWLRFTDYKTGRQFSDAREPARRRLQLLAEIRAGTRLQAVAYGLTAGSAGSPRARGRYLFLRPDLAPEAREVAVDAGDREARATFTAAVRAILDAWDAGSFFPRLVNPSGRGEPRRCAICAVAEACLRGDPGASRRLHQWSSRARAGAPQDHPAEAAMLAAWDLPAAAGASPAEDGNVTLEADGEAG